MTFVPRPTIIRLEASVATNELTRKTATTIPLKTPIAAPTPTPISSAGAVPSDG